MNKIDLFSFQVEASNKLSNRFLFYRNDPVYPPGTKDDQEIPVPFFQFLSAITAAGKTAILSNSIQQIVSELKLNSLPPVIL